MIEAFLKIAKMFFHIHHKLVQVLNRKQYSSHPFLSYKYMNTCEGYDKNEISICLSSRLIQHAWIFTRETSSICSHGDWEWMSEWVHKLKAFSYR